MTSRIRRTVLALNAKGSPGLYPTFVEATDLQFDEGHHCGVAMCMDRDTDAV